MAKRDLSERIKIGEQIVHECLQEESQAKELTPHQQKLALREEIKRLEQEIKSLEKASQESSREAWKEYQACVEHSYEVRWVRSKGMLRGDPAHLQIIATETQESLERFEQTKAAYGNGLFWEHKPVKVSVGYVRDDEGNLTYIGGGYLLLSCPQPITETEWQELKQGKGVEKFLAPKVVV